MFGPDLLVAPVVTVGHTGRNVWLPPGKWVDFWSSTTYNDETGAYDAKPNQAVSTAAASSTSTRHWAIRRCS